MLCGLSLLTHFLAYFALHILTLRQFLQQKCLAGSGRYVEGLARGWRRSRRNPRWQLKEIRA